MLSDTSALAPRDRLCSTDVAKDLLFLKSTYQSPGGTDTVLLLLRPSSEVGDTKLSDQARRVPDSTQAALCSA